MADDLFQVLKTVAGMALWPKELGELGSFGLRDVKYVHDPEAADHQLGRIARLARRGSLLVVVPTHSQRGDNRDSLFTLQHAPAQPLPGVESGDVTRIRPLRGDEHDVPETVLGKPRHDLQ